MGQLGHLGFTMTMVAHDGKVGILVWAAKGSEFVSIRDFSLQTKGLIEEMREDDAYKHWSEIALV